MTPGDTNVREQGTSYFGDFGTTRVGVDTLLQFLECRLEKGPDLGLALPLGRSPPLPAPARHPVGTVRQTGHRREAITSPIADAHTHPGDFTP